MLAELPFIEIPAAEAFHHNGKPMRGAALAQATVNRAKSQGILKREGDCSRCGDFATGRNYHYHHDWRNIPTRVTPLCRNCHRRRHAELGWGANTSAPGRKPQPAMTIRLPKWLKAEIKKEADADNRTISGFMRLHLGKLLSTTKKEGRAA